MSKKRQPGARAEDEAEAMLVSTAPCTSIVPIHNEKFVKAKGKAKAKATLQQYTRDRSPNQRRGRTATLSRSSLKERFSLDGLLTSTSTELSEIVIELGIVQRKLGTKFGKCGEETWKLQERERHRNWRCRKCRKKHSVVGDDLDLFSVKLPLRSLIGSLWIFCAPLSLSPDRSGMVLGIDHCSTRAVFDHFWEFLTPIVENLSNTLKIGGLGQDVELDEISFRSKTVGNRVVWIRYLAIVTRRLQESVRQDAE